MLRQFDNPDSSYTHFILHKRNLIDLTLTDEDLKTKFNVSAGTLVMVANQKRLILGLDANGRLWYRDIEHNQYGFWDNKRAFEREAKQMVGEKVDTTSFLHAYTDFSSYAIARAKVPTYKLLEHYLKIKNNPEQMQRELDDEKENVRGRMTWGHILTETNRLNLIHIKEAEAKATERLEKLGADSDALESCKTLLYNHGVATFTFNASKAFKNFDTYQMLNMWEINKNYHQTYKKNRIKTEKDLFQDLSNETIDIAKEMENIHSLPRYGALLILDRNTYIDSTPFYGKSFVVFKDIAKFNMLFAPGDTLNNSFLNPPYHLCTVHHQEYLLAQASTRLLSALLERNRTGTIKSSYNQSRSYIEWLGPSMNLLDPNLVEHIHIDVGEYTLNPNIISALKERGLSVTNTSNSPYRNFSKLFIQAIKDDKGIKVAEMLRSYPSLAKITDENGNTVLHIAISNHSNKALKQLLPQCRSINERSSEDLTPLQLAVKIGNNEARDLLLRYGADQSALAAVDFVNPATINHLSLQEKIIMLTTIAKKANNKIAKKSNFYAYNPFYRNGNFSKPELNIIKNHKDNFIKILESMTPQERQDFKASNLYAENTKFLDFQLSRSLFFCAGKTRSRQTANELMEKSEVTAIAAKPSQAANHIKLYRNRLTAEKNTYDDDLMAPKRINFPRRDG